MNKLNIGDKIRFLNSVGGGVVKGFVNREVVIIEDEHGFDVPILAKECIVVEPAHKEQLNQASSKAEAKEIASETPTAKIDILTEEHETPDGEEITTCLVFLPVDEKSISNTTFETYFVNDSNYYLFINYMNRKNNSWHSRHSAIVEPNMQIFIEEFTKDQLNDIEQVCIQFVAFKHNKPYKFKSPVSVELRIDTVKFYKLHSFTENEYFDDKALLYYITRNDHPEKNILVSTDDIHQAMLQKAAIDRRPRRKRIQKKEKNPLIEIDLHINQLLDTTIGMDNASMLEYQMDKFHEVMQKNIKRKGQKIVFIHGKGDGVLKKEIVKNLKTKYKKCYYQDASFQEYGFGATMVTIR